MKTDEYLLIIGFTVASLKLLLSGNTLLSFHLGKFTASDFAVMVGALGTIHVANSHSHRVTRPKGFNHDDKN